MPWQYPDNVPPPAQNWSADEQRACTSAANAALRDGASDQEAIYACISAAGKSMNKPEFITKDFSSDIVVKALEGDEPESRSVDVVISVEEEDRDGDMIKVAGIDTSHYMRNPVILFNHDKSQPIARTTALRKEDGRLVATAEFPEPGISAKADEVYGLIKSGVINATSIGFLPSWEDVEERDTKQSPYGAGWEIPKSELLEYSFVSVPSNRSALIEQRSFMAEMVKSVKGGSVSSKEPDPPPEPKQTPKETKKMSDLIELRGKRADLLEQVEKAVAEYDIEDLPEEIASQIDKSQEEIARLDTAISRLERLEAMKSQTAVRTTEKAVRDAEPMRISGGTRPWMKGDENPEKGIRFAQLARAWAFGTKSSMTTPQEWAKQAFGESHPVTLHLQKTLVQGTDAAGGFTVPEDWSSDFIELLRNYTVVRRVNPQNPGMPNGNLTLPGLDTGTTSGYIGENSAIQANDATFREVKLLAKKIAAVTSMSNELLQYNAYGADAIVRDDLVAGMAEAEDAQLLRGTGSATAPTSFKEIADTAGNAITAQTGSTIADIETTLTDLELVLMNNNVATQGAVWIMAPRTYQTLLNTRDGNGNRAFPEMVNWGDDNTSMLRGKRVLVSNQVPINLGTPTDDSELYLVQGRHVLLADTRRMQMTTTNTGSFLASDGSTVVSTFTNDLTAFRLISEHDMNVRHVNTLAYATGVVW